MLSHSLAQIGPAIAVLPLKNLVMVGKTSGQALLPSMTPISFLDSPLPIALTIAPPSRSVISEISASLQLWITRPGCLVVVKRLLLWSECRSPRLITRRLNYTTAWWTAPLALNCIPAPQVAALFTIANVAVSRFQNSTVTPATNHVHLGRRTKCDLQTWQQRPFRLHDQRAFYRISMCVSL